jgi:hypothetical protein
MWHTRVLVLIVSTVLLGCVWTDAFPATAGPDEGDEAAINDASNRLAHRMKGYELYCWQRDGSYHFTLLPGTNRNKLPGDVFVSPEEASGNTSGLAITVVGLNAVLAEIARLPSDELLVVYAVRYPPADELEFLHVPEDVAYALRDKAEELGVKLLGLP